MFDTNIRRKIDPGLDRFAALLIRCGCRANDVTLAGFLVGMSACACIAFQWHLTALVLIGINRLADGLDGAIARRTGSTDLGGFLDIVLDTIFYSGVPFAFAVANQENQLPAAFLIYSFVGTGGSFLAFAVISAKRGVTHDREKKKSFFYSTGLMEGAETIAFFFLFCLWPAHFPRLAWTFAGLCWFTTLLRIGSGVSQFKTENPGSVDRAKVIVAVEQPCPSGHLSPIDSKVVESRY